MKKIKRFRFFVITAVLAGLLAASIVGVTGCGGGTSMERLGHLISELRENVFVGESDNFSVNIITGLREDPFLMDGNAAIARDFTLITLTPKNVTDGNYAFEVNIGGTQFKGEFIAHPFAQTFSAELDIRANVSEIALTVTGNDGNEPIMATSVVTDPMISVEQALEVAENKLRNSLEVFKTGGVLQAEIFIRLIANPIDQSGGYHWYVAFIGQNQTIFAALICSISMQVLAVRN